MSKSTSSAPRPAPQAPKPPTPPKIVHSGSIPNKPPIWGGGKK